MTSVEVQSPPPPPPDKGSDSTGPETAESGPSSTYEWLASVPVLSSAGSTVYGWYEGSKNYTRASKYALDSVESSVKYVADAATNVVQGPLTAVDSFAVKQLVKLEEKVPSIKTDTEEVLECISNKKEALTTRLATGKEAISTSLHSGKDTLAGYIQAGSEAMANSGPGCLVGSSVNRTLQVTENIVDYLLPEPKEEEGVAYDSEVKFQAKDDLDGDVSSDEEGDEEEEEEEGTEEEVGGESNVEKVKSLSRKVKRRVYYRTLRRLDSVQQQCKATLEQLKTHVDLLKMAHGAFEGVDKQYKQLQSSLRNVRQHLGSLVTPATPAATAQDPTVTLLGDGEERDVELETLTPTEKATLFQGVLDYAQQLSEKVFTAFQTVSTATTFLPHHLKTGTSHAVTYSQELYTTLKSAKVPTDIPASVLNKTSEVIETQLGYVKQLGTYIKTSLKAKEKDCSTPPSTEEKTLLVPDEAQEDSSDSEPEEPPMSRPPGEEGPPPIISSPPVDEGGHNSTSEDEQ